MLSRYVIFIVLFAVCLGLDTQAEEKIKKVYFIGNSLTMSSTLDRVDNLCAQMGVELRFGSQLSGGKSLLRHMNYKDEPKQKWKSWEKKQFSDGVWKPDDPFMPKLEALYGLHDAALVNEAWDALVLQPYGGNLHDDLKATKHFIQLALNNKGVDEIYIYATWPKRGKEVINKEKKQYRFKNIDYPATWNKKYDFDKNDQSKQSRFSSSCDDFYQKLVSELRAEFPQKADKIFIIPAGYVLLAVDKLIKDDQLPGIKELAKRLPGHIPGLTPTNQWEHGINVLYADPIHLNPIPHRMSTLGIFLSGSTIASSLCNSSPIGLSAKPYELDDEIDMALIKTLQETIWTTIQEERKIK